MGIEIHPEPSPEERAAIDAAVAVLLAPSAATRSAWWHAGLPAREDEDEEPPS